jgi:hypothetical protein
MQDFQRLYRRTLEFQSLDSGVCCVRLVITIA